MRISDWSSDVCSSDLASAAASERDSAQVSLFGGAEDSTPVPLPLPPVEDWPGMERLNHEFAAIGFYLSAHPLDTYGPTLEKVKATTYAELRKSGSGHVTLAGTVLDRESVATGKGVSVRVHHGCSTTIKK